MPRAHEGGGLTDYERGYLNALYAYAWWKQGVMYVGTTGTTYAEAERDFLARRCDGSSECQAQAHLHGCFAKRVPA